jgi:murein L,D-transpeptidase YcbB/YkuD
VTAALTTAVTDGVEARRAEVRADVEAFYAARDYAPAWTGRRRPSGEAERGVQVIERAWEHGLDAERYDWTDLQARRTTLADVDIEDEASHASALAELDWRLTAALLALGRDVALGRDRVPGATPESRRDAPAFADRLNDLADGEIDTWLDVVQPVHPEYRALAGALVELQAALDEGGWPEVPGTGYAPGDAGPGVAALYTRLIASGDLEAANADVPPVYDETLEAAVRAYQARSGLAADGVAGASTLAALNVPMQARHDQIARNLDRWRRMPDDLGDTHVFVNIAAADLVVREAGAVVLGMPVIVGADDTRTPVFSDEMETVVFSPYWNIPDSIAVGETAVEAATDPAYLARNGIEVLRRTGDGVERVDPGDVDWDDPDDVRDLLLRQQPGADNALGRVKFLFPNAHNVYLHDTPSDALFARAARALSHGCVRVADPQALAEFVLRHDPGWTSARVVEAMVAGTEVHVALAAHLPVHLAYFTARVDDAGRIGFLPDPYDFDR